MIDRTGWTGHDAKPTEHTFSDIDIKTGRGSGFYGFLTAGSRYLYLVTLYGINNDTADRTGFLAEPASRADLHGNI